MTDVDRALHVHRLFLCRDRKRKRFVGETGREANMKKIRTESGRRIPASYQSQAYKRWRERHKIEAVLAGEEEGEAAVGSGGEW